MNRRIFLQAISLAGPTSLALRRGAWAMISAPSAASTRRLVVVFMRGAVDGLSLVVPYNEPNYYRLRSTIAIARPGEIDGVLALDRRFGLHPALAPLMPLWR